MSVYVVLSHWIACLWFLTGVESDAHAEPDHHGFRSWIDSEFHLSDDHSLFRQYIRSVYFAVKGLTTLGIADIYNHNDDETIFMLILILVAAGMFASFVAFFETSLQHIDTDVASFQLSMEYNKKYMKSRNLPVDLQDRINLYYNYMWERSKGVDEKYALEGLSTQLRMDVMMCINHDIIQRVSLFKDCEIGFIKALAVVLQAQVFMPRDFVIRAGTIANQMYFIKDGTVTMERKGVVLLELGPGGKLIACSCHVM